MDINNTFRQIDFLKLFKLCKEKELVNKKRKMPVEYTNDTDIRNSLKRLLLLAVRNAFPDYRITQNTYATVIGLKHTEQDILENVWNVVNNRTSLRNEIYTKIYNTYEEFCVRQPYVAVGFPYNIQLSFVDRNNRGAGREDFYGAARAVIEYKKTWDDFLTSLSALLVEYRASVEADKIEKEQKRILKEAEKLAKQEQSEELKKIIIQQNEIKKTEKNQTAQLRFNELLKRNENVNG